MGRVAKPRGLWRRIAVTVWLLIATAIFGYVVDKHYPLADWLVLRYATYLGISAAFVAATTLLGLAIVGRVSGPALPIAERLVTAVPVGLLAFVLVFMGLGFVGLINQVTYFAVPIACAAIGVWGSRRTLRGLVRHRASLSSRLRVTTGGVLLIGCGIVGLCLIYVPIVIPENIAYDTRWYHMAVSETYAVTGRIARFREGWMSGAMPQLATILYAWCFLLPNGLLFDRIELSAHLEFVLFVATLPGIAVLVRRVVPMPQRGALLGWVFLFFFPGIYLYDSNLIAAADHIAALWAPPLFLTFLRAQRRLELRPCIVFALVVGGLLHTKYTAYQLLIFPALGLAYRILAALLRQARARKLDLRAAVAGPAASAGIALVLWAPHWLKNLLWYRNPFFPLGHGLFPSRPWVENAAARMSVMLGGNDWVASRDLKGVLRTARALADFSFIPNNWSTFHGEVPVFGSLFTLSVPLLLFLRGTKRLWALYALCHAAIGFWYWSAHQDRYLQVTLPLMAAGTAAVLMTTFRELGFLPRAATLLLVALQLAWGSDVPFFASHAMIGRSPFAEALDLASSGHRGRRNERFDVLVHWKAMSDALPKDAVVMIHEEPMHLGIGHKIVTDVFQTGIDYTYHPSPDRMFDRFKALGITHFVVPAADSRKFDSIGHDVVWSYFFKRYVARPKRYGGFYLARMPTERPNPDEFKDRVLLLGCDNPYASGLYTMEDLDYPEKVAMEVPPAREPLMRVPKGEDITPLYAQVDAVVHDPGCFPAPEVDSKVFEHALNRGGYRIWVRKR